MAEKRMLIVDAELAEKIDANRGDMGRSEFINLLLDAQLKEEPEQQDYVSKEEFQQFAQGMKDLLRNFFEFFLSYGVELGKQPQDAAFTEFSQKLQSLGAAVNKAKKSN
ncbi:MAG: hypothetical protein HY530_07955 [Chloroflexi bacterium]|nr:hypothetical protein [Chloroflexota bacterium]